MPNQNDPSGWDLVRAGNVGSLIQSRRVSLLCLESADPFADDGFGPEIRPTAGRGLQPPSGRLFLVMSANDGYCEWLDCARMEAFPNSRVRLYVPGRLRDSEGTDIEVPSGLWLVRVQVTMIGRGLECPDYVEFMYVW
jgi:hypothetical protein